MSMDATFLQRLNKLGLDIHGALEIATFVEWKREGREIIDAVLNGLEKSNRVGEAPDFMHRFIAAFEMPERRGAANDRVPRMNSEQRRARYAMLVERDGPNCCDCGCGERTIWRRNGVTVADDGARFTIVYPTTCLEVDHKTPLWAGGDNELSNLWLLCIDCHKRKTAIEAGQRRRA